MLLRFAEVVSGPKVDHSLWDGILKACVGRDTIRGIETNTFNYKLALEKKLGDLQSYLKVLAEADFPSLCVNSSNSRITASNDIYVQKNQQLALLMNGYNALAVNLILNAMKVCTFVSNFT